MDKNDLYLLQHFVQLLGKGFVISITSSINFHIQMDRYYLFMDIINFYYFEIYHLSSKSKRDGYDTAIYRWYGSRTSTIFMEYYLVIWMVDGPLFDILQTIVHSTYGRGKRNIKEIVVLNKEGPFRFYAGSGRRGGCYGSWIYNKLNNIYIYNYIRFFSLINSYFVAIHQNNNYIIHHKVGDTIILTNDKVQL